MLTSKQRAWLRSQANQMPSRFQVGKNELSENLAEGLDEMLTTHELLKVSLQKSVDGHVTDIAHQLAETTGAQVVQIIGRKFVLYRYSEKLAKKGQSLQLP